MKRIKTITVVGVLALTTASLAFAGRPSSDSIWIISPAGAAASTSTTLSYGSTFKAGYSSKASTPYGHAQCWADSTSQLTYPTSGPILDEYRPVQTDGTLGTFSLSDPLNQEWLGGGANCTLSLVAFQGSKMNVLASTGFTVVG